MFGFLFSWFICHWGQKISCPKAQTLPNLRLLTTSGDVIWMNPSFKFPHKHSWVFRADSLLNRSVTQLYAVTVSLNKNYVSNNFTNGNQVLQSGSITCSTVSSMNLSLWSVDNHCEFDKVFLSHNVGWNYQLQTNCGIKRVDPLPEWGGH